MNVSQPQSTDSPQTRSDLPPSDPPPSEQPSDGTGTPPPSAAGAPAQSQRGPSAALLVWLAVLMIFAGGMTLWGAWKLFDRTSDGPAGISRAEPIAGADGLVAPKPSGDQNWIDEFTLTERSGDTFDSRDLAGKVWVASFFFASCPSYCVQQNQHVKHLHDDFAEQGVTFVSITCDPKNDTPEKLREYARRFDADPDRWLFLTGDLTYIRRIGAEKFGQPVHEQTHKNNLIVVDKWGTPRGSFDWNDDAEIKQLREMLPRLQAETEPPGDADSEPSSASPEQASPEQAADESAADAAAGRGPQE